MLTWAGDVSAGGRRAASRPSPPAGATSDPNARPGAGSSGPTSTSCATPGSCASSCRPTRAARGSTWPTSTRTIAEIYRGLARADASVALVSAMHPAVLAFWLASADPTQAGWEAQRQAVCASAAAGAQWGTITSEPGSGGDIMRTRATAVPTDKPVPLPGDTYTLAGDKHFGSGSGITDFMITAAVPVGAPVPSLFAIDVRGRPWDGSAGATLLAEWDGMGMAATQSHAMRFDGVPAVRSGAGTGRWSS